MRRGLCDLLKFHAGWAVCAEAADGREAVDKVNQLKPDIAILGIAMPNLKGLEAARQMLRNDFYQKSATISPRMGTRKNTDRS